LPGETSPLSRRLEFVVLTPDGRIRRDYQFIEG
jgi:hypothetical protein